jgi:hypothetical protein
MRKLLPELYDEAKIGWSFGGPILGHRLRGGSVKSGVDFYSVEDSFPLLLVPRFRIGSGPRQMSTTIASNKIVLAYYRRTKPHGL